MTQKVGKLQEENPLMERVWWLIRLRWIAAAGVIAAVYVIPRITEITLSIIPLYSVAGFLIVYNGILSFFMYRFQDRFHSGFHGVNLLANGQISLDLICLAVLVHFSGGVENPFIFYFIFHMIIASILLTRREAFSQATYAILLFLLLVFLEYRGFLPHYCLWENLSVSLHTKLNYIAGISFVFISTLYISVYMATSVSTQLKERDRRLVEANQLLREKDRVKSEYVLRVTHDIRQDLAAIQSCIEPVTMGITGSLNKGQEDLLRRVHERSLQLIVYVDALLDITKIKLTQKLKMEKFFFPELIQQISEQISELASQRQLCFETKIDPVIIMVEGVRIYIQEALLNLLKNSLKYTPAGGRITLEAEEKNEKLFIKVEDTGIGIPAGELPHVFEEFYRAKNASAKEKKGTGLGLSITKQIVEAHRGKIWVESQEGKGTTFRMEFPILA